MEFQRNKLAYAVFLACAISLAGCGGGDSSSPAVPDEPVTPTHPDTPTEPADPDFVDSAPVNDAVTAYVDASYSNTQNNVCHVTVDTNAGIRLADGFLDIWTPATLLADAGRGARAAGTDPVTGEACPAVPAGTWDGNANSGGTVVNQAVHDANIRFSVQATNNRSLEQEETASIDQPVHGAYLMTEGMGHMAQAWRDASGITGSYAFNPDRSVTATGTMSGSVNSQLGKVVVLIDDGLDQPDNDEAKRFYKYARPYLWDNNVKMAPGVNYTGPSVGSSDFVSGHTVGAWRRAASMAYAMPERFQEFYARAMIHGQSRVWGGAHSPLASIGGRMSGLAIAAANLYSSENPDLKQELRNPDITAQAKREAREQALTVMQARAGTTTWREFYDYLHAGQNTDPAGQDYDRFADHGKNKAAFLEGMNYGMTDQIIHPTDLAPVVPKGAEVLIETRYPYLTSEQRRVVLKTTAFPSGYPVMTDEEGWGRLNMFAAGDGYGQFNGLVTIDMDSSLGTFATYDIWRNDISGEGKLVFNGDGTLKLGGRNSYSGGTLINGGALEAASASALGSGSVQVNGGTLIVSAGAPLEVGNNYTQSAGAHLEVVIGADDQVGVQVKNTAKIEDGTLHVKFAPGYQPIAGTTLRIISAGRMEGDFSKVTVDNWNVLSVFTPTGISVDLAEPK
ncbi:serine protease [plant metagenome]|uniref:Serine protease n=1 Tax=plant metagenome TaxID=1297885 RepID=A0A484P2T2_9ZZZZ